MYGHHVHEAVLKAGCKVTGVTVHLVDEIYDHGSIIAQHCVPVKNQDTPDILAATKTLGLTCPLVKSGARLLVPLETVRSV